jgi:radical SAM superfamily enzyme YgiQ (UPF0313 family)
MKGSSSFPWLIQALQWGRMPRHEWFFREHGHLLRDRLLYLPNPTFSNPAWADAELRVLVVRLSSFRDVDRSSTHLVLARELRRDLPGAFVDLAFLPVPEDRALMERHGVPLLVGIQSHRTIEEFDLVLVSTSCLPELVNLPFMLARSHVPVWSRARNEDWPIIVLGGSNAAAAHATVADSGDAMADALFFGEGEGAVGPLATACRDSRGFPKPERLEAMARAVEGLWPAGDLERPARRAIAPAGALDRQGDGVVPLLPGAESCTAWLEITRGCPSRCAFCFEARDRGRFRTGDEAGLLAAARSLKAATGASTLEVASLNFNTHPHIAGLLEGFHRSFALVNAMSQRPDILARTPGLVDLELAADKRSFALGVEGVNPSMRAFLGKRLDDADLWRCLDLISRRGVRELKLFFIVTGRENERDLAGFAAFVRELRRRGSRADALPRTIFSFGMLVRMPFTPLAFDPVPLEETAWRRISGRIKSTCETNGFEFRMAMSWTDWLLSQLAALGGYRVHGLLETLADRGCVYDAELPREARPLIAEWCRDYPEATAELAAAKPAGHPFPFAFLQGPPTRSALWGCYQAAVRGRDALRKSGSRAPPPVTPLPMATPEIARRTASLAGVIAKKHRLAPVHVRVEVPAEASGFGGEWLDAWLARQMFREHPPLVDTVLSVREALIGPWTGPRLVSPWHGVTIVAVTAWEWSKEASRAYERAPAGFEPGVFTTLDLEVDLPHEVFPWAAEGIATWLRNDRTPATVRRTEQTWTIVLPEAWLKRRSLLGGGWRDTGEGIMVSIRVGRKFDLPAFLSGVAGSEAARLARVRVVGFEP